MSTRLTHLVYQSKVKLGRSGRAILLCLAHHANDKKNLLCYPSIGTLAIETEMSVRQVIRAIIALQKIGALRKETHGRNNYYFIIEEALKGNKSYPQIPEIGDTMSPIDDSIGDIPAQIGDILSLIGDIPAQIGDTMSPNNKDIKYIKKDITENFFENEKKREENRLSPLSPIRANPETLEDFNQKKHFDEAMKSLKQSTAGIKRLSF